jgi:hypothetical protein
MMGNPRDSPHNRRAGCFYPDKAVNCGDQKKLLPPPAPPYKGGEKSKGFPGLPAGQASTTLGMTSKFGMTN